MATTAKAASRLISAYQALFEGRGNREDADLVKADLAEFTGFYGVQQRAVGAEALNYQEGRRSVFARIVTSANITSPELEALEARVRTEAFSSNT